MPDPQDDDALRRWASSLDGAPDDDFAPAAPVASVPHPPMPPAPVGFVNAWDPGLNRYILMAAIPQVPNAPAAHTAHPTTPVSSNPIQGGGVVIPFRSESNMLVKGAGDGDKYDKYIESVPEIPIPGTGGTDGMAGRYDPALAADIAAVQAEIRASTPGMHGGFVPMEGDGRDDVARHQYPNGSAGIADLPRAK